MIGGLRIIEDHLLGMSYVNLFGSLLYGNLMFVGSRVSTHQDVQTTKLFERGPQEKPSIWKPNSRLPPSKAR